MKRRTIIKTILGGFISSSALTYWLNPKENKLKFFNGTDLAFGTNISIKLLHHDEKIASKAIKDSFLALKEIDNIMSLYKSESQISNLNREGFLKNPDYRILNLLKISNFLSRKTNGAFDPSVQTLWVAAKKRLNTKDFINLVNWKSVNISDKEIKFDKKSMSLTLNGIAQGYGSDVVQSILKKYGIKHALIDTGEFSNIGTNKNETPWKIGIKDPKENEEFTRIINLDGRALATAGSYESLISNDGKVHHIFDPISGESPSELISVSVLAPTAVIADGLSTAFMVMGKKKTINTLKTFKNIDIFCVDKDGNKIVSKNFPNDLKIKI